MLQLLSDMAAPTLLHTTACCTISTCAAIITSRPRTARLTHPAAPNLQGKEEPVLSCNVSNRLRSIALAKGQGVGLPMSFTFGYYVQLQLPLWQALSSQRLMLRGTIQPGTAKAPAKVSLNKVELLQAVLLDAGASAAPCIKSGRAAALARAGHQMELQFVLEQGVPRDNLPACPHLLVLLSENAMASRIAATAAGGQAGTLRLQPGAAVAVGVLGVPGQIQLAVVHAGQWTC